ncbi:MAG: GNAT family acetyltransferase [Pseudomonadales bacterium]
MSLHIRSFQDSDTAPVVRLWQACGLVRPWNDPHRDIARKMLVQPELFLVGTTGDEIVATVMAGYEGHRGWVNYLAVSPSCQGRGYGRVLMQRVEAMLLAVGCPKVNLQVRQGNVVAMAFYEAIGYAQDASISYGKRLIPDE